MVWSTGISVRGPSHKLSEEPNQDALGLWGWRQGQLAIVCDGLGSRPLSHIGSKIACIAARKIIRSGFNWDDPRNLISQIYQAWLTSLPIAPSDAACTFLLAACRDDGDTIIAQLGDGVIAYRSDGDFGLLTPDRDGFSNQTNALGISKKWGDWQVSRLQLNRPGDGVMLMTDGISDDLVPELRIEFFKKIYKKCSGLSHRRSKRWLQQQLEDWPTPEHSDDKTIAMIFRGQL